MDNFGTYDKIIKIIDDMDADNWLLIMPDELEGLDFNQIKAFQRFKFQANNSNLWEFEHPLKEYSFELGFYYSNCFYHNVVPDDKLYQLLKLLLVDMALTNFVALFPCYKHYFDDKDYQAVAEFLFQLMRENQDDHLVCDTIRFFICETLVNERLIKWHDVPKDVECIIDNIEYKEVTAEEIEAWGVVFTE